MDKNKIIQNLKNYLNTNYRKGGNLLELCKEFPEFVLVKVNLLNRDLFSFLIPYIQIEENLRKLKLDDKEVVVKEINDIINRFYNGIINHQSMLDKNIIKSLITKFGKFHFSEHLALSILAPVVDVRTNFSDMTSQSIDEDTKTYDHKLVSDNPQRIFTKANVGRMIRNMSNFCKDKYCSTDVIQESYARAIAIYNSIATVLPNKFESIVNSKTFIDEALFTYLLILTQDDIGKSFIKDNCGKGIRDLKYIVGAGKITNRQKGLKVCKEYHKIDGNKEVCLREPFISIPSTHQYYKICAAIANNLFEDDKTNKRYSLNVTLPGDETEANIFLVPSEFNNTELSLIQFESFYEDVKTHDKSFNEHTVDIIDIMYHIYSKLEGNQDFITCDADLILRIRGKKERTSNGKSNKGYRDDERDKVMQQVDLISMIKISGRMSSKKTNSKFVFGSLFEIKRDITNSYSWLYRPNREIQNFMFSSRRQTMLLPIEILNFNYNQEYYLKRIARYLYWLIRVRSEKADYFSKIDLSNIKNQFYGKKNVSTDKITKAIYELRNRNIFSYIELADNLDEVDMEYNKTTNVSHKDYVVFEPPIEIIRHYQEKLGRKEITTQGNLTLNMIKANKSSIYSVAKEISVSPNDIISFVFGSLKSETKVLKIRKYLEKNNL